MADPAEAFIDVMARAAICRQICAPPTMGLPKTAIMNVTQTKIIYTLRSGPVPCVCLLKLLSKIVGLVNVLSDRPIPIKTTMPSTLQCSPSPLPPVQTYIRPPHATDFALHALFFDSALPFLAARGSAAQWGTLPMAERPGIERRARNWDERCKEAQEKGGLRAVIAEREISWDVDLGEEDVGELQCRVDGDSGKRLLTVAVAVVSEAWFPDHVEAGLREYVREAREQGEWVYLEMLLSDCRTGKWRRGGGTALVEKIRAEAASRGLKGFYEGQGFKLLSTFSVKKGDTETWDGALLKMDLSSEVETG
nr:hypothetical protein CFP56_19288 [Quercus suber]